MIWRGKWYDLAPGLRVLDGSVGDCPLVQGKGVSVTEAESWEERSPGSALPPPAHGPISPAMMTDLAIIIRITGPAL